MTTPPNAATANAAAIERTFFNPMANLLQRGGQLFYPPALRRQSL